jgi:hypothetical protein
MKALLIMFLIMVTSLLFFGCSDESALAPELDQSGQVANSFAKRPISDSTEYDFVGHLGIFDSEGRLLAWKGTVSGDINGVIKWWMVPPISYTGQASHYEDRFEIWNAAETELLLAGDEAGTTTARHGKNSNWRTSGTVTEVGQGFGEWLGRQEHSEGHFSWAASGLPDHGDGTFKIN